MPLTKEQKAASVEEISALLDQSTTVYLTNYSGLTVAQSNELRKRFREAGVKYHVLKNTLVRLAMDRKGGYEGVYEHLNGPTAVAFSEEPSTPARVLQQFLRDQNLTLPELKAAYIDGAIYGSDALETLTKLKSKNELIGDILGLLLSPMTNVVGALQAQGSNLLGAIKTISEKES